MAETASGKLTFIPRQSFGKPGGSCHHGISACGNRASTWLQPLPLAKNEDPTVVLAVAVKHRIYHVRKIAQLHRERLRFHFRFQHVELRHRESATTNIHPSSSASMKISQCSKRAACLSTVNVCASRIGNSFFWLPPPYGVGACCRYPLPTRLSLIHI